MKKETSVWEHFKGDFKSKPKEESSDKGRFITIPYDYSGRLVFIDEEFPNQQWLERQENIWNVKGYTYRIIDVATKSCIHDPVDIGFTTPKLVCKKCDKDL